MSNTFYDHVLYSEILPLAKYVKVYGKFMNVNFYMHNMCIVYVWMMLNGKSHLAVDQSRRNIEKIEYELWGMKTSYVM